MTAHDGLAEFLRLPVRDFPALGDEPDDMTPLPAASAVAWRLWLNDDIGESDETYEQYFARFLGLVDATEIRELVISSWGSVYDDSSELPVRLLCEAADRLPNLRAIALGDVPQDEAEISWIEQSDLTPLLEAFPRLEILEVRGGTGLSLRPLRHEGLRVLRVETGGLPGGVVRAIGRSELPGLEHLELWLGVPNYGGDWRPADFDGVRSGEGLPALRHLGLQNSDAQDEVAALVAAAPVVARLESLALSMGVLTDEGAEALLSGQPLTHLKRLDLHHHYLTDPMIDRLRTALPDVDLNVDEQEVPRRYSWSGDEDHYYVVVSE